MRTDSRSINFSSRNVQGTVQNNSQSDQTVQETVQFRWSEPIEDRHPITLFGDMNRDSNLFKVELSKLPLEEAELYGRLQVMRSAAQRELDCCNRLIGDIESQRNKREG